MSATVSNYEIIYTSDAETAVFSRQIVEADSPQHALEEFMSVFPFAVVEAVVCSDNNSFTIKPK